MRRFLERIANLLRLRHPDDDLGREIEAHLALLQETYETRGMAPDAARRAARLAFGSVDHAKEQHRDARSFRLIEDARQDVVHGLRLLRRSPLFTLTAATSLAIGIGANTAIATVANSLLFRAPSGISEPERLIDIGTARGDGGLNPMAYSTYLEVARRTTSLSSVYAQSLSPHVMSLLPPNGTGIAERVRAQHVTANFFTALGSSASVGRVFAEGVDGNDDGAAAVLDYDYWKQRFNSDTGIIGRALRINGRLTTVVGVTARDFQGIGIQTPDLWLALPSNHKGGGMVAGARVRSGAAIEQAMAEVVAIGDAVNAEHGGAERQPRLSALAFSRAAGNRNVALGASVALMILVSLVLAIACANVAGVVFTRATARAREIALRAALGAGRARLVRQLLTETLVLYVLGGVLGLGLAYLLLQLASAWPALSIRTESILRLDWRVVLFALLLSMSAAVVSGVLPALKGSKADPGLSLKDGARSSHGRSWARGVFVTGQIALSVLLVVVSALFVRALRHAGASNPGFDPAAVQLAVVDLTMSEQRTGTSAFWRRLIDDARQLTNVESASLARVPPGGFEGIGLGGVAAGDSPDQSALLRPGWNIVDTGYFSTLRIPIVAGRDFTSSDTVGTSPVVVVSVTIAGRLWPGRPVQDIIGRPLTMAIYAVGSTGPERKVATVVGVAGDIKSSSLLDGLAEPYVYLPLAQGEYTGMATTMTIVARSRGRGSLEPELAAIVRTIDPGLVLADASSLADAIALGLTPQRVLASVAGAAGLVGLQLATMGIYGITAYAVALRRREFAIRLALGAPRARVIRMVLRQGLVLVMSGLTAGLAMAAGVERILSGFFYGLSALHAPTMLGTIALFIAVGAAACVVPAAQAVGAGWRRALQED